MENATICDYHPADRNNVFTIEIPVQKTLWPETIMDMDKY